MPFIHIRNNKTHIKNHNRHKENIIDIKKTQKAAESDNNILFFPLFKFKINKKKFYNKIKKNYVIN